MEILLPACYEHISSTTELMFSKTILGKSTCKSRIHRTFVFFNFLTNFLNFSLQVKGLFKQLNVDFEALELDLIGKLKPEAVFQMCSLFSKVT